MNDELFKKMHPLVNGHEWDIFVSYIATLIADAQTDLENCPPDNLRKIQGRMSVYRHLLTLRGEVNNVVNATKH